MPFPSIFWVIANDLVMANDLDDLDGAAGNAQPPQGRETDLLGGRYDRPLRRWGCRHLRVVAPMGWGRKPYSGLPS
jgi:hypothetical protein